MRNVLRTEATDQTDGPNLAKVLSNAQADVITGRKPISAWDSAVSAWRKNGGDTIKSEYEKAWSDANS